MSCLSSSEATASWILSISSFVFVALIKIMLDSVVMVSMVMPRRKQISATSMLLRKSVATARNGSDDGMSGGGTCIFFSRSFRVQRWKQGLGLVSGLGVGLVVPSSFGG